MVRITTHAEDRLKERCGLNKKSIQRIAEKAYENGIRHCETKGNLRKWLDGVYLSERNANNLRLYGDKAFVFRDDILITVMQIPQDLRNDMKVLVKRKTKNEKEK